MTDKRRTKKFSLDKKYHRKHTRDFVDMDYLDKLNTEELRWLDEFMAAYYRNCYGKGYRRKLREWSNADNARRRDIWNKFLRASNHVGDWVDDEQDS